MSDGGLRLPLFAYCLGSAAAIPGAVLFLLVHRSAALAVAIGIAVVNLAAVLLIRRQLGRRIPGELVVALCVAQFVVASAMTLLEGWALHLAPLVCLAPVVLATRFTTPAVFNRLAMAALAVITGLTLATATDTQGPIVSPLPPWSVDVFAIVVTPALVAFIAWIARLNEQAMLAERELVARSQRRVFDAELRTRSAFTRDSYALQTRMRQLGQSISIRWPQIDSAALKAEIKRLSAQVRDLSQDLDSLRFVLHDRAAVAALFDHLKEPPQLTLQLSGLRSPTVDGVIRDVLAESVPLDPAAKVDVSITHVGDEAKVRISAKRGARLRELGAVTSDRVNALGGSLSFERSAETNSTEVVVPILEPPPAGASAEPRPMRNAIKVALVMPSLSLLVTVALYLTLMPHGELLVIAGQIAVLYLLPCAVSMWLADRSVTMAAGVFAASHWVIASVVAQQLDILKFFAPAALLVPLLVALPHVSERVFGLLTVGTVISTAVMIAIARIGTQLEVAQDAPDVVKTLVVSVLVPVSAALVLLVAARNQQAMAAVNDELVRTRLALLDAFDSARSAVARDLHDTTQQRLVSAAVQFEIALVHEGGGRRPKASHHAAVAGQELERASESLDDLAMGPLSNEVAKKGLRRALHQLATLAPVPVSLHARGQVGSLAIDHASTIYFCCSEALANSIKHAGPAVEVVIDLEATPTEVTFEVADNGRGFRLHRANRGQGLSNMSDRLSQCEGTLDIRSEPGSGTVVSGRLPH